MTRMERTMAAATMDLTADLSSEIFAKNDLLLPVIDENFIFNSVDLFSLIDEDNEAYMESQQSLSHPWEEIRCPVLDEDVNLKGSGTPLHINGQRVDVTDCLKKHKCSFGDLLNMLSDSDLPEEYLIMVNPRDLTLVNDPFMHPGSSEKYIPTEPQVMPKPYHPSQDHDYLSTKEDNEEEKNNEVKCESFSEEDPDVEVWEIENFMGSQASPTPAPEQLPVYRPFRKETRRSSARTAEIRRREQARKISNAVHAVLKTGKARSTRQFKSIKPKNSVETTPSQSDIEEFYSQPVRQTYSRITKKKTCKGRIDHSESERHRREVLRRNFSSLCDLIPNEYLRGDKVSSQISKQKILNGAKSYIVAVHSSKSSYKTQYHQNSLLRERWQKAQAKLLKSLRQRQK